MTIANDSTILQVDLDSAHIAGLTVLASDVQALPATVWVNLNFNNLISTTDSTRYTRNIPIRDNYFLREVCVTAGSHAGTITVTVDNGALIEDIEVSGVATTGFTKLTRYFAATHPLQVLLKGSSVAVACTTTDTSATSSVQVALGFMTYRRRL